MAKAPTLVGMERLMELTIPLVTITAYLGINNLRIELGLDCTYIRMAIVAITILVDIVMAVIFKAKVKANAMD